MSKTRAVSLPSNDIGKKRYELYKNVIERINQSCEQGFYLEAISLTESLIADRLESHMTFIKGKDFSFKTLERLIKEFKRHRADIGSKELSVLVEFELDVWREKCHCALHEMAKIDVSNMETWEQKSKDLAQIAHEGFVLFRQIDKQITLLRKKSS